MVAANYKPMDCMCASVHSFLPSVFGGFMSGTEPNQDSQYSIDVTGLN